MGFPSQFLQQVQSLISGMLAHSKFHITFSGTTVINRSHSFTVLSGCWFRSVALPPYMDDPIHSSCPCFCSLMQLRIFKNLRINAEYKQIFREMGAKKDTSVSFQMQDRKIRVTSIVTSSTILTILVIIPEDPASGIKQLRIWAFIIKFSSSLRDCREKLGSTAYALTN